MTDKYRYLLRYLPLSIVFGAYISVPLIASVVQEDRIRSDQENRRLSQLPEPPSNAEQLQNFPKALDEYYSDHFGFREQLYGFYFKLMNYTKLNSSTARTDITQGLDGWLFLGNIKPGYGGYSDPMGDAMNINLYTQEELRQFANYTSAIKQWLKFRGIEYANVVTPIKHTIYPDKLPPYIEKRNEHSALDQLVGHLRENTDVTVIDLREPLKQERAIHDIYYQTDSHWNSYGANVGQFEIMKQLSAVFPDSIEPFKLAPEQFDMEYNNGGDLARNANLEGIREQSPQPRFEGMCEPINETPDASARDPFTMVCEDGELNALIFRDSFFTALVPYFSRQFKRSTYIWNRLDFTTLSEFVEKERPDIVIDQVVERTLPYLPNGRPFLELAE